jgi:hypothetical protein
LTQTNLHTLSLPFPETKYISPPLLTGLPLVSAIQMPNESARKNQKRMKTDTRNKTGNGNTATAALAKINAQIEALNQQRIGLAQPLKDRYAEMRGELSALETEIRSLDAGWKPAPLKPRADDKIRELITEHGKPMSADEIVKAVGGVFTPWKVKNTLKKKSTGAKAVFTVNDGKFSIKAA